MTKLLEERASSSPLDLCEVLRLQSALLEFALTCYPGRLDYVNHCLGMCVTVLGGQAVGTLDEASVEQIELHARAQPQRSPQRSFQPQNCQMKPQD